MLTLPPISAHTTLPDTFWSCPSIETLAVPVPELALADAEAVAELLAPDVIAGADELDDDDFSLDEQPDKPATTIAAPPTATSNPRFTTVSFCNRDPTRSTDRPQYYGLPITPGQGIARNIRLRIDW
jgi:hypothetical protein